MFSDRDLRRAIDTGRLVIDPFDERLLQPASIDMRMDDKFMLMRPHNLPFIDLAVDQNDALYESVTAPTLFIGPGQFVLASTFETLTLNLTMYARIEGKSSLGRLGLLVHSTAGFIDPGFSGTVTLEIGNISPLPIKLYHGMPIAQLAVGGLDTMSTHAYEGKYQGQKGPKGSHYYRNFAEGEPMDGWV